MQDTIEILQAELDLIVDDVMTERRKHPELTDEDWFESLPGLEPRTHKRDIIT